MAKYDARNVFAVLNRNGFQRREIFAWIRVDGFPDRIVQMMESGIQITQEILLEEMDDVIQSDDVFIPKSVEKSAEEFRARIQSQNGTE